MPYASTSSSSSLSHTNNDSMVIMAKATKKSSHSQGSGPNPPRITSNVKHSLKSLKLWKDIRERRSGTPKPVTGYRRKKLPKEALPGDEVKDGDEDVEDPTTSVFNTNQGIEIGIPVLLVDGYNVCGYWPKLKKHFFGGKLDVARQKLIEELMTFSSSGEVKVVVVFDAQMSGLPSHKESFFGIDVVYSARVSADTWIEKEVVALKEDGCPEIRVVTSDNLQQVAAYEAGAFVWSCRSLISAINDSEKELKTMLHEQRCTQKQIEPYQISYTLHSKNITKMENMFVSTEANHLLESAEEGIFCSLQYQ